MPMLDVIVAKPEPTREIDDAVHPTEIFHRECLVEIAEQSSDPQLLELSHSWIQAANVRKYSYHFGWMGRPIIQYPQDIVALQELIWRIRPQLIIETGIAHGGSLMLSASMLSLLDYCDAVESGQTLDPRDASGRRVIGIDIDIRAHNRAAIETHPLAHRIIMVEGSSIAAETVAKVTKLAEGRSPIMIILDSNHTHDHVLAELAAYGSLTSPGQLLLRLRHVDRGS